MSQIESLLLQRKTASPAGRSCKITAAIISDGILMAKCLKRLQEKRTTWLVVLVIIVTPYHKGLFVARLCVYGTIRPAAINAAQPIKATTIKSSIAKSNNCCRVSAIFKLLADFHQSFISIT